MQRADCDDRFWPNADIRSDAVDVRFWPKADIRSDTSMSASNP